MLYYLDYYLDNGGQWSACSAFMTDKIVRLKRVKPCISFMS